MFVPISCGVSRGTQLEYAWFNLKEMGICSSVVPVHTPLCLSCWGLPGVVSPWG